MPEETVKDDGNIEVKEVLSTKVASKPKAKKSRSRKRKKKTSGETRKRTSRPYPKFTLQEALTLGGAIHKFASGEKVRRLTLLKHMDKSPTSSATQNLITNSSKYGLTKGSYLAEWLELTELGSIACNPEAAPQDSLEAQFKRKPSRQVFFSTVPRIRYSFPTATGSSWLNIPVNKCSITCLSAISKSQALQYRHV